jgi:hypothetical protein
MSPNFALTVAESVTRRGLSGGNSRRVLLLRFFFKKS